MNKGQLDKLSMYIAVQKVVKDNNTIWSGLAAFVAAFADYEGIIDELQDNLGIQEKTTIGVTDDKSDDKENMANLAFEVGQAVVAFASDTSNKELKENVDFSLTQLSEVRDSVSLERCTNIYKEALEIVSDLGPYGVDNPKLVALLALINTFEDSISNPREAIITKKGATSSVVTLIKANDIVLEERMDTLMEQYKTTEAVFYKKYFDARIIVDAATRTTFVTGTVLDSATALPILIATVKLTLQPGTEDEEIRVEETDELGAYEFSSMIAGTAKLQVDAPDYKSQTTPVEVERGKVNEVNFLLDPV